MIVYLSCMADSYPMSVMIPVIIIFTHTFFTYFSVRKLIMNISNKANRNQRGVLILINCRETSSYMPTQKDSYKLPFSIHRRKRKERK